MVEMGVYFGQNDRVGFDNILYDILSGIDVRNHDWVVDCRMELTDDPAFEEKRYNGEEFLQAIQSDHQLYFIRLRRYPINAQVNEINDYDDYLKSDCSLVLLCYDCGAFEIFAKDAKERHILYNTCKSLNHDEVEYITDQNNGRTEFYV